MVRYKLVLTINTVRGSIRRSLLSFLIDIAAILRFSGRDLLMLFGFGRKKKLLVTDDNIDLLEVLKARLESHNYIVITASNGQESLAKAASEMPDVILLDIMMPGMNGFEVCKQLKENEKTKNIPVVILSALGVAFEITRDETLEKARELGVAGFVTKPYVVGDLLSALEKALGKK